MFSCFGHVTSNVDRTYVRTRYVRDVDRPLFDIYTVPLPFRPVSQPQFSLGCQLPHVTGSDCLTVLTGGILQSLMGGMGDMDMGAPPSRLPPAVSAPAAVDEDLD